MRKKAAPRRQDRTEQDNDKTLQHVARRYAVRITDSIRDTIHSPDDPVALQYLPQTAELALAPGEDADPIGDSAHSPVPGIIHRYPDRVLLTPVHACAAYCRFCFRRETVGPGGKALKPAETETALTYIRDNPGIHEVILSGGDPLIMAPRRLGELLQKIEAIPHVQHLRIHTRLPVADPPRIDADLCRALETQKALYIVIHVNHAQELSGEAEQAIAELRRAGCVLLSQSVLLRGVNDNVEALETLFRRLVSLRVKPYYLHHPDLAPGTSHFRLSLGEGQDIMRQLHTRLSGLCRPVYMLDIPGGHGKVPAGPCYIHEKDGRYVVTDPHGRAHLYPPETNS